MISRTRLAAGVCLVFACCGSGRLLAASVQAPTAFHFTVTADPRGGHAAFSNVLAAINAHVGGPGVFHLTAGDFDKTPAQNRLQLDGNFGATCLWYTCVGNHETEDADANWVRAEYSNGNGLRSPLRRFTNQNGPAGSVETIYSWDYSNAHWVVLNEYWNGGTNTGSDVALDGNVVQAQRDWLAADLAACTNKAIFVIGHEPAYLPAGWNHYGNSLDKYPADRDAFWDLLEAHGVVAYLCGHTHSFHKYQKAPNRTWQIDAGNAGNDDHGNGYTFLDITVSPSNVQCDVWRDTDKSGAWVKSAESFAIPLTPQAPAGTLISIAGGAAEPPSTASKAAQRSFWQRVRAWFR